MRRAAHLDTVRPTPTQLNSVVLAHPQKSNRSITARATEATDIIPTSTMRRFLLLVLALFVVLAAAHAAQTPRLRKVGSER